MRAVGTMVTAALAATYCVEAAHGQDETSWDSPKSTSKYAELLNRDTDKFVSSVADWASRIADKKLEVDSSFTVRTDGHEWSETCGDLSAHQAFPVLESFLDKPAEAHSSLKQATPLEWRPEDECVNKNPLESLDGGAHAQFDIFCGEKHLAHAISGGSGFYAPNHRGNNYVGGAKAAVHIGDEIELAGELHAGSRFHGNMHTYQVPKDASRVVDNLHATMRDCAQDGSLVIQGVAGGGWTQHYKDSHGKRLKSVVGYANSFTLNSSEEHKHSKDKKSKKDHEHKKSKKDDDEDEHKHKKSKKDDDEDEHKHKKSKK
ncbi:hypothetical protein THRCLA_21803, partial [Thraustotheca clavata]